MAQKSKSLQPRRKSFASTQRVRLVTIFGGGGFVGRYGVQALLAAMGSGLRLRIAQRRPHQAMFLKPLAELGQIHFVACDIRQPQAVARAVAGSDVVINLVGSFANMDALHHRGAANIAAAAREAGAQQMIHMSALGADVASRSTYGQSKAAGEAAVRSAFPEAVILRPSVIFGSEDAFINRFAALIRMFPVVPVICPKTRLQPVYVGDVASAIAALVRAPQAHSGATYELGGLRAMSMLEIQQWIADALGYKRLFLTMPRWKAVLLARGFGWLPKAPLTYDQWLMLQSDNILGDAPNGLAELGVTPTPLDALVDDWLVQYRRHGRFALSS